MRYVGACILPAALVFNTAFAAPAATDAPNADAAKGQAIASGVCAACHGADGNSTIPSNPVLAGQHPEYLYKQLANYKSGARKNPIMNGIAAALSEDDMRNAAAWFASQRAKQGAASDAKLATAGQKFYRAGNSKTGVAACASCHSPDGVGIPVLFPRLKGQHSEYTIGQLKAFRAGERANDPNAMMRTIAARMTDQEMAAAAEYIAGLK